MSKLIYKYVFDQDVPIREIENSLLLAVLAVESLHGKSRVRLDTTYCLEPTKHTCVIDASAAVGKDICRIFTGFITREFGEESFSVCHADTAPIPESEEISA
jgi:hypothetical protein